MPLVFQLTTMLINVKSAMGLNSMRPSCVNAPPFWVVRLVRLFVNWYSQSTPELVPGSVCARNITETIRVLSQNELRNIRLPCFAFMSGGRIVLFAVLFHLLPESFVTLFLLLSNLLLLFEDGCRLLSGSSGHLCLVPLVGDRSSDGCENSKNREKYFCVDCLEH